MRSLSEYALAYLVYGWQPIPVHYSVEGVCSCGRQKNCPTPGKHPVPPRWQNTPFDEKALGAFWSENEHYNIGLVTGPRTNLVALDVDAGAGGFESLRELEDANGLLPETTTASTGGGGRHHLFQYPKGLVIPTRGHIRPGLDIRGDGGQIVAPPSLHNKGTRYSWLPGRTPNNILPVQMPPWLIRVLEKQEPVWLGESQGDAEAAEVYYGGSRNNNLFSMGRRLRVIRDISPDELRSMLHALNQSKCRPPLDEGEVDILASSVLSKGGSQTVVKKELGGKEPPRIRTLDINEIWSDEEKPIPYIIPNLLSEGEVCLLASPTEAGKSLIAMSLSLSVAAGLPAWGRGAPCPPGRVMYCTEELAGRTIKRRFRQLARGLGIKPGAITNKNLLVVPQQNLSLALRNQTNIDALLLMAQEFRPTLVILDTFVSYFGGQEKEADANRAWFGAVPIALRAAHNCGVIVQHHTRKMSRGENGELIRYGNMSDDELNNEIRGTSDLAGVAERIWFIWKRSEEANDFGPTVRVNFRNTKAREGDKHGPIELIIMDPDDGITTVQSFIGAKSKKHVTMEKILRAILPEGTTMDRNELVTRFEEAGIKKSPAYRWISIFMDQNILLSNKHENYKLNPSLETPVL